MSVKITFCFLYLVKSWRSCMSGLKFQSRALDSVFALHTAHPDVFIGTSDSVRHPDHVKPSLQEAVARCVNVRCTSVLSLTQRFVDEQPRAARELLPPSASCPCGCLRLMEPRRFPSSPALSCKITRQYGSSRPSPSFKIQKFLFAHNLGDRKCRINRKRGQCCSSSRGEKPGLIMKQQRQQPWDGNSTPQGVAGPVS